MNGSQISADTFVKLNQNTKNYINKLKSDNYHLKETIDKLIESKKALAVDWQQHSNEMKKIDDIKEERDAYKLEYEQTYLQMKHDQEMYQKVLEQNEKLKEDIEGDGWLKQGYKTELSNSHKQQNRMVKEITKLKKENKKLKEQNQQLTNQLQQSENNEQYQSERAEDLSLQYVSLKKEIMSLNQIIKDLKDYRKDQEMAQALAQ